MFIIFGAVSGKFVLAVSQYEAAEQICLDIEASGKRVEELFFDDAEVYLRMYPAGSLEREGQPLNFRASHRQVAHQNDTSYPIFEFMDCF